jgi:hypothetical protein
MEFDQLSKQVMRVYFSRFKRFVFSDVKSFVFFVVNKSSGMSSGAWKHRLRTKGWNYHVSPKGVSIKDDTNNEN